MSEDVRKLSRNYRTLAQRFHEVYEQLAPKFQWETQDLSRVPWEALTASHQDLMVATVQHVLDEEALVASSNSAPKKLLTPEDVEVWRRFLKEMDAMMSGQVDALCDMAIGYEQARMRAWHLEAEVNGLRLASSAGSETPPASHNVGPYIPPVIYDAKRGGFYDSKDGHRLTGEELAEYRRNNPPAGSQPDDKPWRGAPRTDAIWQKHTEDAVAVENRERELSHYYEMACHACQLERELAALSETSPSIPTWQCGCGHTNGCNLAVCAVCGRKPNGEHP